MKLERPINCAEEVKPSLFPSGESRVVIEKVTQKATKKGGWMLNIQMANQKNQKLFDRVNLGSVSEAARSFSEMQLMALGKAAGLDVIEDTDELIGREVFALVEHKNNPDYGWQANVKRYSAEPSTDQTSDNDVPF